MSSAQKPSTLMFKNTCQSNRHKINPIAKASQNKKDLRQKSSSKTPSKHGKSKSKNSHEKRSFYSGKSHKNIKGSPSDTFSSPREKSQKTNLINETNSTLHELESPLLLKFSHHERNTSQGIRRQPQDNEIKFKKGRKFSEDTQLLMRNWEGIRVDHLNQEKELQKDLTDLQMHRLRKIHAVQQAKCMFLTFQDGKSEKAIV